MKYLIYQTQQEADDRSAQQAQDLGSNEADVTRYWWPRRETAAGTQALCVPDDEVGMLTEQEQAALVDDVEWSAEDGI